MQCRMARAAAGQICSIVIAPSVLNRSGADRTAVAALAVSAYSRCRSPQPSRRGNVPPVGHIGECNMPIRTALSTLRAAFIAALHAPVQHLTPHAAQGDPIGRDYVIAYVTVTEEESGGKE